MSVVRTKLAAAAAKNGADRDAAAAAAAHRGAAKSNANGERRPTGAAAASVAGNSLSARPFIPRSENQSPSIIDFPRLN